MPIRLTPNISSGSGQAFVTDTTGGADRDLLGANRIGMV